MSKPSSKPASRVYDEYAHELLQHVAIRLHKLGIDGPWLNGAHVFAATESLCMWIRRELIPTQPEFHDGPPGVHKWPSFREHFDTSGYVMPEPPKVRWCEPEPCPCRDASLMIGARPSCVQCGGLGEIVRARRWQVHVTDNIFVGDSYAALLHRIGAVVYPPLPPAKYISRWHRDNAFAWFEAGNVSGMIAGCDPVCWHGSPQILHAHALAATSPPPPSPAAPPHQVNDTTDRERDEHDRDLEHRRDAHGQSLVGAPETGDPPVGSPMNSRP